MLVLATPSSTEHSTNEVAREQAAGSEKKSLITEEPQQVRKGYNYGNRQDILGEASTDSQSALIVIVKSRIYSIYA